MTRMCAATVAELPPGTAKRVTVAGRAIALFSLGGTVYAVDDRCPHEGGRLSLGTVEALRRNGVVSLRNVRYVILEEDGHITVLT